MITKEEAKNVRLRCPDDKIRWDIFIDDLYDTIGTCKDCKHADRISNSTLLDCTYIGDVTSNFYCANFEKEDR